MIVAELNNQEINDVDDMIDSLSEEFTGFLITLCEEEGMTREPTEDDPIDHTGKEGYRFYTTKAQNLIEAEEGRLHSIGQKYFPGEDTPVESYMYTDV